jgi:hypothetical protein
MKAAVFANEPCEISTVKLNFVESHEVPGGRSQILMALIAAGGARCFLGRQVVPLLTCNFARLAPDAEVDVDQL